VLRPEGFALLPAGGVSPQALAAVMQTVAGARFPPPAQSGGVLGGGPEPATLARARLVSAGAASGGVRLVRAAAAMAPPGPAVAGPFPAGAGAVWDARFRLLRHATLPAGAMLGAVAADASRLRRASDLPAAVLRTLPAIRHGTTLLAVPHLDYPDRKACEGIS